MSDNIYIIGGADGPTSVFVAGKLGMNWLSTFGLDQYTPDYDVEKIYKGLLEKAILPV